MTVMKKFFFLFAAFALSVASFAQGMKVVADKIIAIVGDRIILQSEITNAISI